MKPFILLINPWAYDFAAYDLWAKPLGLLYLGAILRKAGCEVGLLDCLDRAHPRIRSHFFKQHDYGCGKYYAEEIPKPEPLAWIPRKYQRYGLPYDVVQHELASYSRQPDAIFVSSRMTYWYPGVLDMIALCREAFPTTPVALGGVYPTLTFDHANLHSGADVVIQGNAFFTIPEILRLLSIPYDIPSKVGAFGFLPSPAYDLVHFRGTLPVLTSVGCPMKCAYCASSQIFPSFEQRDPLCVAEEITALSRNFDTRDMAFYDDALLVDTEIHFDCLLDRLIELGNPVRLHLPNGIDYTSITRERAQKMFKAGFKTLRLSLETSNNDTLRRLRRVSEKGRLKETVGHLLHAGFLRDDIGVYILAGLPEQDEKEVKESIDYVVRCGGSPRLVEYSPIPRTALWEEAQKGVSKDICNEPLLHNNSVYHMLRNEFGMNGMLRLRNYIRGLGK